MDNLRKDERFTRLLAELSKPRKVVAILVYDGVELLDFAGPGEVFETARASKGGSTFKVVTVAASKGPILSSRCVKVVPSTDIANCPKPDVLIIPGGDSSVPAKNEAVVSWVKETAAKADVVLSVCTGRSCSRKRASSTGSRSPRTIPP
jgi:transcriptional regulator GlxA family with amidase domain